MDKKLYKSSKDQKLCGVCGGIAEYFNIDSTVVRLIWAIAILCCGTGILAYVICAIIMPDAPDDDYNTYYDSNENKQ